eukprot:11953970-Heterocapsa_arctica.AAC.1
MLSTVFREVAQLTGIALPLFSNVVMVKASWIDRVDRWDGNVVNLPIPFMMLWVVLKASEA